MKIKTSNLSFKYDKKAEKNILNSINLEIKEGTINVLLGLNGCGKTTLIKLLAGLEKPTEGIIQYGEDDLQKIKIKRRAKIFSYVPHQRSSQEETPHRHQECAGGHNFRPREDPEYRHP